MKEFIKTALPHVPGGAKVLRLIRAYRLQRAKGGAKNDSELFTHYYKTNTWGDIESRSGPGSTVEYTANIRKEIPALLQTLKIRRILDAPCGDYNWFQHIPRDKDTFYTGADIVSPLIQQNQQRFANENTKFVTLDITKDELPEADLWLCRDALFHLSDRDVFRALANFSRSNIPYLLTTSHTGCTKNTDIPTGSFRMLNLERPPFSFCPPHLYIDDWIEGFPVCKLCLWDRQSVNHSLATNKFFQGVSHD